MSKEAASADLQAAAYWRNVASTDRVEVGIATAKANELTTDARRERNEPMETQRRTRGVSST